MSRYDRLKHSWAILPATMELWGKRKITIEECASIWNDGTVLVCTNEQGRICFIHGASGDYGVKIGESHLCHHDQTGVSKGYYTIVNIVHWVKKGDAVLMNAERTYNRLTKASLAVFK